MSTNNKTYHAAAKRADYEELRRLLALDKSLISTRARRGLHCGLLVGPNGPSIVSRAVGEASHTDA